MLGDPKWLALIIVGATLLGGLIMWLASRK